MRQQINLFQNDLIEKKMPLHAGLMAGIFAGCAVMLLLASFSLGWQQGRLDEIFTGLQKDRTLLAAELQLFRVQNPPRGKDPRIEEKLEKMRVELAGRRPLLAYFERFDPRLTRGFSPVIAGFARYPLEGVWLRAISLNALNHQILLVGSATRAELIPAYLQHLGEKQVIKGQTFASLKLTRIKENARQVDFRLESEFGAVDE